MELIHTVVFENGNNGGNPAPVFIDADKLTDEQMLENTKSLGCEAVFVLKPTLEDSDVRLRYFLPDHELSTCAHVTIGAITALLKTKYLDDTKEKIRVQSVAGPLDVFFEKEEDNYLIIMEQFTPTQKEVTMDVNRVAKALGTVSENIKDVKAISTSRYKLLVSLTNKEVLNTLNPDYELLWEICDELEVTGFYPFVQDKDNPDYYDARQFPLRGGYLEDPATGVAASALNIYHISHAHDMSNGFKRIYVRQGEAMGRPSLIVADALVENQRITKTRVAGYGKIVNESTSL